MLHYFFHNCKGSNPFRTTKKLKFMRSKALNWWRELSLEQRQKLAKEYKPEWSFEMVNASSSTIEKIFIQSNSL